MPAHPKPTGGKRRREARGSVRPAPFFASWDGPTPGGDPCRSFNSALHVLAHAFELHGATSGNILMRDSDGERTCLRFDLERGV